MKLKEKPLQFDTENLRKDGHCWAVSTTEAILYYGLGKDNKWKKRLTFHFDVDCGEFYDSPLHKDKEFVKKIIAHLK